MPVFDEVVVSTSLMNDIESEHHAMYCSSNLHDNLHISVGAGTDLNSSVVTCQAGVVLERLDQHLAEHGLMVPLDLGAKGSCHIGASATARQNE